MIRRVVILGAGKSGIGAAILANAKGIDVMVSDQGKISTETKQLLDSKNIKWEEGKHSQDKILSADEVIKSPGIPEDTPIIKAIRQAQINIVSEIEFAFRYTKGKVIAITGSNGKTTTTSLLGHILKNAGLDVLVAGNIGVSFAQEIAQRDYDYIVLEISSFQLDDMQKFKPHIAIILNITPDHLNRYNYNFSQYILSKLQITKNQSQQDYLIFNQDDETLRNIPSAALQIPFSLQDHLSGEGAFYKNNTIIINQNNNTMMIHELALQGKHNIYNSMAAAIASRVLEIKNDIIRQSMMDFQNIEHRLEYVLSVHGIDFINDSKATNINSCWYALESMTKPVIWIVGGIDKGNDYTEVEQLVKSKVKGIICMGESAEKIKNHFKKLLPQLICVSSMQEAVESAYKMGKKGDVVLLSPACASFDMFDNYEHRGQSFKEQVRKL